MRRTKRNNQFKDVMITNEATFNDYMYRFKNLATSMFEWVGLPDSMDADYLEEALFYYGSASLLYDEMFGFINTKASSAGKVNIYGLPTEVNCYSFEYSSIRKVFNGLSESGEKSDGCILVKNNKDRIPTVSTIQLYASRMAECQRAWDVNIKNQKFPVLILTDDKQRLTMMNMYAQIDGNSPAIFADRNSMTQDAIKALNTQVPFVADKLTEQKKEIWNELLTFLGINNLDNKKERLIVSETNSNNEVINLNLQSYLAPRKRACELFNKKYGMNIDVKVRSDLHNIIKETENSFITENGDKYVERLGKPNEDDYELNLEEINE